jgi:uncharacterized protein DUF1707
VTAEPWDPVMVRRTDRESLRASDADRERVLDTLHTAFGQGRLGKEEFLARADRALDSRTYGELAAITLSIPGPGEAGPGAAWTQPRTGIGKKTVAWGVFLIGMPATLGAAFVTHYRAFFVLFVVAFIGVTVTAQPDG